jgi:Family of unknown function (DUF6328)
MRARADGHLVEERDETTTDESHKERVDRELIELLNELRVAIPGIQVLFAFLLTLPFSGAFDQLSQLQRTVYFATLLMTAAASAFLMTPASYHRLRFRKGDKERMLRTANRFAIAGTALLAASIGGSVYLVADVMYGGGWAGLFAGATVAVLAGCWFILPLSRKVRDE